MIGRVAVLGAKESGRLVRALASFAVNAVRERGVKNPEREQALRVRPLSRRVVFATYREIFREGDLKHGGITLIRPWRIFRRGLFV